jgi:hypothetical protein
MVIRTLIIILSSLSLSIGLHAAETSSKQNSGSWQWEGQIAVLHRADSDLDTGGKTNINRSYASLSASTRLNEQSRFGLSFGYGEDRYDFSGNGSFAGLDPWDRERQARISASMFYKINDRWTAYGIPSLSFNAEKGASMEDGRTAGLLAGASYRFSETLTLGPGIGVFEQIEEDASFIPVLIVDWQITDNLSLETGRGFAASRGPGLQFRWQPVEDWQFSAGARYEKRRFRLDDQGPAPDGVGEYRATPIFVTAQYEIDPSISVTFIGGADTNTRTRLENENGDLVTETDADNATFLGASIIFRL